MAEGVRRRVVPRLATWPGGPEATVLAETVLERDLLKTRIEESAIDVLTSLYRNRWHRPWTAVWTIGRTELVWLHFYDGPTTPGGLEEAHHCVVAHVRAGTLPGLERPEPEGEVGRGG